MLLTFSNGTFTLITDNNGETPPATEWSKSSHKEYITKNLSAAARFRSVADKGTEELFQRVLSQSYSLPAMPPLHFLDPHQRDGIKWILSRSRSYLAHAPGAGKTCEAITASMLAEGEGCTVFIVPPSLTINWEREIHKFTEWGEVWPSITIVPESRKSANIEWRADFIIVPDSMLAKTWVLKALHGLKIKLLAVDEASRFKEDLSQRTVALFGGRLHSGKSVASLARKARYSVLLDGSPMPNRHMELWAPTYAMAPETIDFMDKATFGFKYCGAKVNEFGKWEFKGSSNAEELREKLRKNFMHVVTEEELGHSQRKRSILLMTDDPRTPNMKKWDKKNIDTIKLSDLNENMNKGTIATYRREIGIAKVPWIAAYVNERLSHKGESILLFAWHREVCLALAEALNAHAPGLVMGGTADEEREHYFKQFQSGKRKLIIGNIAAMGRGHNLQRADRIIFGEYSWTDETNKQCEKRASRRGRDVDLPVRCEYIVVPNSIDEVVLNSVFTKESRVKRVIG